MRARKARRAGLRISARPGRHFLKVDKLTLFHVYIKHVHEYWHIGKWIDK